MKSRFFSRLTILATITAIAFPLVVRAQEEKPKDKPKKAGKPVLTVNFAGIERVLQDLDYMFEVAGRPEMSEIVSSGLAAARDLKGLNRQNSMGIMLYLNGLIPEVVGYVPVDNLADLMSTITFGPVEPVKVADDHYKLEGPGGTVHVVQQGSYLFVSNSEDAVKQEFGDPAALTKALSAAYDVALRADVQAIPKSTRDLILGFMTSQMEADLQQRDGESDELYELRRAGAEGNMDGFRMFLNEAEEITLGWDVSKDKREAAFEMVIKADPKTEYAALMNDYKKTRSRFVSILDEHAPLSVHASFLFDKAGTKSILSMLKVGGQPAAKAFARETGIADGQTNPIDDLFSVMISTVQAGKLNMFVQFLGEPPGPYTLTGAFRLAETEKFTGAIKGILERLQGNKNLESVQLNVATHGDVTFHRIVPMMPGGAKDAMERLYGKDFGLVIGVSADTLWFSVGSKDAIPVITDAIDKVAQGGVTGTTSAPLQVVFHMSSWLALAENQERGFVAFAKEAFADGQDAIRADMSTMDNGMKFRLSFQEGWIRLVGKGISAARDAQQSQ